MRRRLAYSFVLAFTALSAATAQLTFEEKASFELLADRTAYQAGDTVRLAAAVRIEDGWHMNSHTPTFDWLIPTQLSLAPPPGSEVGETVYPPAKMMAFAFTDEPIAVYEGEVTIVTELVLPQDLDGDRLAIDARLRYQACDDKSCLPPVTSEASIVFALGAGGTPANQEVFAAAAASIGDSTGENASGPPAAGSTSLVLMLLLGVVGGLILNAMPCVLPVLSLKLFGIVQSADKGRAHLVAGSLATAAGIIISFLALAGAAVIARAAGNAVGWGVQFQQPGFVAFLAVVVVLFSLNMWGLFEIPLPAFLSRVGGSGGDGLAGHFASGLFATLMATPCSAPFLGTAVGFALAQPASVIFAVFAAVGVGLALPYLLLAVFPGLARLLPRPGTWMVTLRGVLGFFLAAAAVWLFFVLAGQIGSARLAAVQLTLLVLALFVWLHGRLGPVGRRVAVAGTLLTALGTLYVAAAGSASAGAGSKAASARHQWLSFDEQEAESLAAGGTLVFVDVTADWCLTCKTNEWGVLETDTIDEAFDRYGVVTMKADWTNRDDVIGSYLAKFGRSSIPFYVLYRPGQAPHVFGELLTRGSVLDALEASAPAIATVTGG